MKIATRSLCLLLLFASALARAGDAPPALAIRQVLALAEKALADKGMDDQVFIQSVALVRPSLSGARDRWEVSWSSPIDGLKPGSKEVGLQISMNGDVVHLVKGKGEYQKFAPPH